MSEENYQPGISLSGFLPLGARAWRAIVNPAGRSRRRELLAIVMFFPIAVYLASLVASVLLAMIGLRPTAGFSDWSNLVVALVQLLPLPAVIARRFHDLGRSAWYALPVVPMVLVGIYGSVRNVIDGPFAHFRLSDIAPVPAAVMALLSVAYAIAMLIPGQMGPNKYGPDPRGFA